MENREISEILEQIEKSGRQRNLWAKLQLGFSAAAFVLCLVLVITALRVLPGLQSVASRAEVVLSNLETVTQELTEMELGEMMGEVDSLIGSVDSIVGNVDSLIGNVDEMVSGSRDSLEDTVSAVSKIDFETLNQAIKDLADVVEPLADFFNIFDR